MGRALAMLPVLLASGGVLAGGPPSARAQLPGVEDWAAAISDSMSARWTGPRVEPPAPSRRPALPVALRSVFRPLAVHADASVPAARVRRALDALEAAQDVLDAAGWAGPQPDGGLGGTSGFDLYLVKGEPSAADARADSPLAWSYLDAVSAFGVVDPSVGAGDLAACVTASYAEASLMGQDPAESAAWRKATGAWLTWMVTGEWGCDAELGEAQRRPWRAWIGGAERADTGGALFVAMLSARHDSGTGTFVRDLWQAARQRTWERRQLGLRASPDLWEVLQVLVDQSPDELDDMIEDFAIARWFVGGDDRERGSPMPALNGLPSDARVQPMAELSWAQLPAHTRAADPALEPYGSGYVRVDVRDAPPGSALRLWLRGEYGVRWSFVALRLDEAGREIGRMRAPPRANPHGFLVLELVEGTAEVLLAVTNLSSRIPDADEQDENVRSFRLIVSRRDGGGTGPATAPGPP